MGSITINKAVVELLTQSTKPLELRDEGGNVVGTFVPADVELEEPFDLEEARRTLESEKHLGITTEELLRRLHAMDSTK